MAEPDDMNESREPEFTPAPWRVECGSWTTGNHSWGHIAVDRPTGTYRKLPDGSFEEIRATGAHIASYSLDHPEGEANARLIAAAPELFDALVEAKKATLDTAEATGMHRPALIALIDAVLAKAIRGEHQ